MLHTDTHSAVSTSFYSQENNKLIPLVDVDGTLLLGEEGKLNLNLVQTLKGSGFTQIYLFTAMSLHNDESGGIPEREKLISQLKELGITVLGVITPHDLAWNSTGSVSFDELQHIVMTDPLDLGKFSISENLPIGMAYASCKESEDELSVQRRKNSYRDVINNALIANDFATIESHFPANAKIDPKAILFYHYVKLMLNNADNSALKDKVLFVVDDNSVLLAQYHIINSILGNPLQLRTIHIDKKGNFLERSLEVLPVLSSLNEYIEKLRKGDVSCFLTYSQYLDTVVRDLPDCFFKDHLREDSSLDRKMAIIPLFAILLAKLDHSINSTEVNQFEQLMNYLEEINKLQIVNEKVGGNDAVLFQQVLHEIKTAYSALKQFDRLTEQAKAYLKKIDLKDDSKKNDTLLSTTGALIKNVEGGSIQMNTTFPPQNKQHDFEIDYVSSVSLIREMLQKFILALEKNNQLTVDIIRQLTQDQPEKFGIIIPMNVRLKAACELLTDMAQKRYMFWTTLSTDSPEWFAQSSLSDASRSTLEKCKCLSDYLSNSSVSKKNKKQIVKAMGYESVEVAKQDIDGKIRNEEKTGLVSSAPAQLSP